MKYALLICLILVGCGSDNSSQPSSGGGGGSSSPAPTPVVGVATPNCGPTALTNQVMIACPELTSQMPEILLKQGNSVLLMTPTGGGISYTLKPPGNYSTSDGRGCNYRVNSDGTVDSI